MISKVYKSLEDYSKKLDHSNDTYQPIGEGICNRRSKIQSMVGVKLSVTNKGSRNRKELYSNDIFTNKVSKKETGKVTNKKVKKTSNTLTLS